MTRVKLKGINRVPAVLADGRKVHYYYHRATGLRLTGKPGSAEFVASWQAASASVKSVDRSAGTLAAWVSAYRASDAHTGLATATRKDYAKQIAKIEAEFGDMPLAALQDPRVRAEFLDWRDRLAKTGPRQADYAITVLGRILSWAVDRGFLAINPAAKPGRKYTVDRSQIIWEPADVAAFMAKASVEMQLAMIVALNTGQRQGDLLAATWTAFEGGRVKITQSKRGVIVDFAQTAELRRILQAAPRRAVQVLTTPAGLPWKADHFRHEWRAVTLAAGIERLRFNDIRGTTVTRLADAECTPGLIASITGHSQRSVHAILDKYQGRTRAQGDLAIAKLERSLKKTAAKQVQNGRAKNESGAS